MTREVELSVLDLRYESFRLKQAALEERLLGSIAQRGIEEPLEGVELKAASVLLNGFKRYRCARKLCLPTVPYACLGQVDRDELHRTVAAHPRRSLPYHVLAQKETVH